MSLKVLVVEDEALIADDLRRTLTRLGYEVPVTVASGADAIASTERYRPSLVLMDIKLKGAMDGVDAAERIKHEYDVPVIFLTAHSDDATLARAKVVSPQGYLVKPFGERELRGAIEVGLHNHDLERENARLYHVAQGALRARDDVLQVVAHELRNPLNALLLAAEALLRESGDEGAHAASARRIRSSGRRMSGLIQDLLDVERLDAGEPLSLALAHVSVDVVLAAVVDDEREMATKAGLTLTLDIREPMPPILADVARLRQVLENLVGNAIKFTKRGGTIVVGASRAGGDVRVFVRDSGRGIAPDELDRIFDRFWQAGSGDRRGAGLGLAIVKGIVEALRGRVWVESELGAGTTFSLAFPALVTGS